MRVERESVAGRFANGVLVALLATLLMGVASAASAAPIYRLEFEGPAGDFISGGEHVVLTDSDVGISSSVFDLTGDGLVDGAWFTSAGVGELFFLLFFDTNMIPANLLPGTYPDAQRSPFADPGHPGFWLAWNHRGCNMIEGSFVISEATFGPSGPTSFSASFEQSCEGFMPPLAGTFVYSDAAVVPEPFSVLLFGTGIAGLILRRRLFVA
jgi:hypothetical protein